MLFQQSLLSCHQNGLLYKKDSKLRGKKDIEIKEITSKDEDILLNQNYIKKGVVLDKLIESLLVDKTIKSDDILLCDKNALIMASRITSYGPEYNTEITCPKCNKKSKQKFDLRNFKTKKLQVQPNENGLISLTLPKTGFNVEIKALDGKDEKILVELMNSAKTNSRDLVAVASTQIKLFVKSINGKTDRFEIEPILNNLPAMDARFLRTKYKEAMPDIDMKKEFICSNIDCEHKEVLEVPLDARIFLV